MTDLIDRYVSTVLRRVPEKQRADIDRELRASIFDAVDARTDGGEPRDTAVQRTLTELGDPSRLADSYADRPQHLLGPEFYPSWRRLMILLFSTVLPLVVAIAAVVEGFEGAGFGKVIGSAISAALTTGVHLAFWTTATFVVLERSGVSGSDLRGPWTLDDLPAHEPDRSGVASLAVALSWPVLVIAAIVLQQFTFTDEPVLNPANWSFWWPYLIVVLVLEAGYQAWAHCRPPTHVMTAIKAGLVLLSTVPLVWLLAEHRFYNPELIDSLDWGTVEPITWLTRIGILVLVGSAVYDIAETTVRVERFRRGQPAR